MSQLENYIIIPIIQDFSVKGYVARYGIDKDDPKFDQTKLRYINSKFTNFSRLLCGIDEITNKTTAVILVEGFFDKISVTTELGLHDMDALKCFCTFGKKVSPDQIGLMTKTNIKDVILMYDERDAVNDMKQAAFDLKKYFNVTVAATGDHDPGDLTQPDFINVLDNLKTADEFWLDNIQKKQFK